MKKYLFILLGAMLMVMSAGCTKASSFRYMYNEL